MLHGPERQGGNPWCCDQEDDLVLNKSWNPLIHILPEGTPFLGLLRTLVILNRLGLFFLLSPLSLLIPLPMAFGPTPPLPPMCPPECRILYYTVFFSILVLFWGINQLSFWALGVLNRQLVFFCFVPLTLFRLFLLSVLHPRFLLRPFMSPVLQNLFYHFLSFSCVF